MKKTNFIGIDVSKVTLDICLVQEGKVVYLVQISNNRQALRKVFTILKKNFSVDCENTLCCMEYTGIYNYVLLEFLWANQYKIWLERALQIKQSSGLVRGKSDQLDASRIALYAYKNERDSKLWEPERSQIVLLKSLITTRNRLIKIQKQLSVPLKESQGFMDKECIKVNDSLTEKPLKSIENAIIKTEERMMDLIKNDENLKRLFLLVKSVDGVGPIVALNVIAKTNEFKNYGEARKFACFSGIAPFPHSSGTSIHGRTRVSHMACKPMKTLMHLAAMAAINTKGELGEYYKRKLLEGKNKMSIVNAIRNKIIARIFAVVKRNEPYQKILQNSFA